MRGLLRRSLVLSLIAISLLTAAVPYAELQGAEAKSCTDIDCGRDANKRNIPNDPLLALEEALSKAWAIAALPGGAGKVLVDHGQGGDVTRLAMAMPQSIAPSAMDAVWPPVYYWDITARFGTGVPPAESGGLPPGIRSALEQGFSSPWLQQIPGPILVAGDMVPLVPGARGPMMVLAAMGIIALMIGRRMNMGAAGGALG